MRTIVLASTAVSCLFLLTWCGSALAQSTPKAAAEALFESARELSQEGHHADACPKYEASQKLDPAVGTLLYLGDCYERIGKTASAWATFREASSLAQTAGQTDRREIADQRAAALEPGLSRLEIIVPLENAPPDLSVELEGIAIPKASWGLALPVDPGMHTVIVAAPGYERWSTTIEIEPRSPTKRLEIPPLAARIEPAPVVPLQPPPPITRARDEDIGDAQRITGIVLGSVGLAGLTAGAILGGVALMTNEDSLDECRPDDPSLCTAEGVELRDDAESLATGSTIAFSAGGALVATGIIVFFTAPTETRDVEVLPIVDPKTVGLILGGAW